MAQKIDGVTIEFNGSTRNTIRIYDRVYTVIYRDEVFIGDRRNLMGASTFSKSEIEISNNLTPEMQEDTLAHEVAHIAMQENGLANIFTRDQVEAICDLTSSVYRIMERNKKGAQ